MRSLISSRGLRLYVLVLVAMGHHRDHGNRRRQAPAKATADSHADANDSAAAIGVDHGGDPSDGDAGTKR